MKNLYIEVSDIACDKLKELLSKNKDYKFIRLYNASTCCKIKPEVLLEDKLNVNDEKFPINDVIFIYDKDNLSSIKKITLLYEDNKFYIKADKDNSIEKDCTNCTKHSSCGNCKSKCR